MIYVLGLDPAFPFYKFENVTSRLSWKDAKYVDVIHTDGGVLGNPWPLGHADFYPNQGIALQPGCAKQELSKNRWYSIVGKSHMYDTEFFRVFFFVHQIQLNFFLKISVV